MATSREVIENAKLLNQLEKEQEKTAQSLSDKKKKKFQKKKKRQLKLLKKRY